MLVSLSIKSEKPCTQSYVSSEIRKKVSFDLFGWTASWSKSFKADLSKRRNWITTGVDENWSLSQIFGGTFVFRVMQGGRLSWRRLFSRTYLHFFVLTLWDYFTQGASHTRTKRFTLLIVLCLVYTVSMTVSGSCKGKRVLPNPRHKRLRHMNNLRKRRLGTITLSCKVDHIS